MKEKIRVLQDGKRLAILIEDTSADLLKKVQEILSVATAELVVGLTDPVANDIPVPQETSQPVQNMSGNEPIQEQPAQVQPKEAAPQSTVSTPFRFPNGKKHGGETVCDVIASGDIGYLHFILTKIQYRNRAHVVEDFFSQAAADALVKKFPQMPNDTLRMLCDICDSAEPNFTVTLLDQLGYASLDDVFAAGPQDAGYVYGAVVELMTKRSVAR